MPDFNSASDMDDIYRNMEKLHKKLKDLGYDLDEISDQLKLYHATEAKRIYQMRAAIIDWERITHYQKERLKANKEDKDHRTKRNMEEHAEYFRQIRRNMRMRQSHSSLNEQLNLTTKALFGGGIGLGTVFGQLIKGGKAVADAEEERVDLEKDVVRAYESRNQAGKEGNVADFHKYQEQAIAAQKELKEYLKSPQSRLGNLSLFGKTISERLQGGSEFFKKHGLGIMLSIGSIGLLVTALKLVYNTSPMMQASVKLLGLIWNLGLRPIGDFFGFVMRPIFIMLLRSFILPWYKYAYPFYQKWGNKIGEFVTAPSWEKLEDIFDDIKALNLTDLQLAIAGVATMMGVGGAFYLALKGLIGLINKITGKTPTPAPTPMPKQLPPPTTTGSNISKFPEHLKPFSTLYTGKSPTTNLGAMKNVSVSENVKTWISKQWNKIKNAGARMSKSMEQMSKQFWARMETNPITKRLFSQKNMIKLAKGGMKGGIGFVPAIADILMEAINPTLYKENKENFWQQYPFFAPDFDPATGVRESEKEGVLMAHGGIIREPIHGIGRSGQRYTFGESGAEVVTPMGKTLGGTSITINIQNMSGSTQDLNNLRQTILAVIQEANTRGGRI